MNRPDNINPKLYIIQTKYSDKKAPVLENAVALLPDQRFVEPRVSVIIMWELLVAMAVSCTGFVFFCLMESFEIDSFFTSENHLRLAVFLLHGII